MASSKVYSLVGWILCLVWLPDSATHRIWSDLRFTWYPVYLAVFTCFVLIKGVFTWKYELYFIGSDTFV